MDILKWLEETEQPQVPQATCRRKHSQKQPKSDSSLLEPLSLQTPFVQQQVTDQNASQVPVASPSDCSSSSHYVRKPRRKTRPERYEINAPKRSKQKSQPSKARHKSRQKNGQGPGQLVQSYRAKNVSGDRLTLRPPQPGLFNKGRTSTAARGRGLPDLVFSEMKFLQKYDDSRPPPQSEVPKKKRKKDHTHTKEGEISSFFASGHDKLRKESEDSRPSSVGGTKRRRCDRSPRTHTVVPTIELGDRDPCLGFQSQQPRHESISHVSWPESIRACNTTPLRVRSGDGTRHDQYAPGRHGYPRSEINRDKGLPKRSGLAPVANQPTGSANGYFQVSSLAPSHSRVTRSQSCPQYSSSPRRVNLVDRSEKLQRTEKACTSSSMPPAISGILDVNSDQDLSTSRLNKAESRTPPDLEREAHLTSQSKRFYNRREDYAKDLETSSDFGRVLQVCKESIHNRHLAAPSQRQDTYGPEFPPPTRSISRQYRTNSHTSTRRIPIVRFAELPRQYPAQSAFAGPGIYEQQEQRRHPTWDVPGTGNLDDYTQNLEEEYMDENSALYYDNKDHNWDDMDDMLEASLLHEPEDNYQMHIAGSAVPMDNVSENPRPVNEVVAPGFWRPNKLY